MAESDDPLAWLQPAGAIDPNLIALAQRVQNLGEADDRLASEISALRVMLDERLPTKEEMTNLRAVLSDKAGREYLQKQMRRYGIGGLSLLASIYLTRNYLAEFFATLARVLK